MCDEFVCSKYETCLYGAECLNGKRLCPFKSCGVQCSICVLYDSCRENESLNLKKKRRIGSIV